MSTRQKQVVAQSFTSEHVDYRNLVASINDMVDKARHHVFTVAASSQVQLYWTIGESIVQLQEKNGWGDAVVETLAFDLNNRFPKAVSFSARNLWLMRQRFTDYRDLTIKLKQAASELVKLKQLVSEIPWGQNILILQKTTNIGQRRYYKILGGYYRHQRPATCSAVQPKVGHCRCGSQNLVESAIGHN